MTCAISLPVTGARLGAGSHYLRLNDNIVFFVSLFLESNKFPILSTMAYFEVPLEQKVIAGNSIFDKGNDVLETI